MASVCDSYCKGCIYLGTIHKVLPWCKYLFMEDKRRPCPPGAGCTVKLTSKEVKKKAAEAKRANEIERMRITSEKNREHYAKKRAEKRKICRYCGKEFTPTKELRFFCCAECAAKQNAENNRRWNREKWQKRKAAMKAAREAKGD